MTRTIPVCAVLLCVIPKLVVWPRLILAVKTDSTRRALCVELKPPKKSKSSQLGIIHFRVIVGVHELQSIDTLASVQSLSKIPEFGAVSLHSPVGSPLQTQVQAISQLQKGSINQAPDD